MVPLQQYKSTPDLRDIPPPEYKFSKTTANNISLYNVNKAVPEEMFHLYQTRDAFGNLLAQW